MSVTTLHPEYSLRFPEWETMRDCMRGERHIKLKGVKYLPKSNGQKALEEAAPNCVGPYESYKSGGRFPEIVDSTIQGFVGLATRKPWLIEGLPKAMEYLNEDAGNGLPLEEWQGLLIAEGLEAGRYAMFPDAPVDGGDVKIAFYQAESIVNWKLRSGKPWLGVLREEVHSETEDLFEHRMVMQYRVIRLEEGKPIVELYDEKGELINEAIPLSIEGEAIPLVVGGAVNNDWEIDKPPILGVADCALAYYKLSCQQRWAIRATCDPMFLALGFEPGEIKIVGGGSVLEKNVKPGEATFTPIEVSGTGIDKATEQMIYEIDQAEKQSHLLTDKASVEASNSLRQRTNSKTASLKSVERCAVQALEKTLNLIAEMQGIKAEITVTSEYDYTDEEIDATALLNISSVVERAHMPKRFVIEYVKQRGGMEGYTVEEIMDMIEEDEEAAGAKTVGLTDRFFNSVNSSLNNDEDDVARKRKSEAA